MKLPAFFCKGIEIGRTNLGTTKGFDVAVSHVINEYKHHIRLGIIRSTANSRAEKERKKEGKDERSKMFHVKGSDRKECKGT